MRGSRGRPLRPPGEGRTLPAVSELFVEPFGGIAGDMLLGALLDLGDPRVDLDGLQAVVERVLPGEVQLAAETVWRGGLSGTWLQVTTPESGTTPHRGLPDLLQLLGTAGLSARARSRAAATLEAIAVAEGTVHGCSPEEVHFHEVGAVDTVLDVVGAAWALERLEVERVWCTPPLLGSGTVTCAHGRMPVPAPAVAELLRGRPTLLGGGIERTTPTGAALLVALTSDGRGACASAGAGSKGAPAAFEAPASFRADAVGYGAGTKDPTEQPPNLLRVQLGSSGVTGGRATAWQLEVTLDDITPQDAGHALARLREAGALEAWSAPVQMKKDRPGAVVTALCREGDRAALEEAVFAWTPSLGLRWTRLERVECARQVVEVELEGHAIRVKLRTRPGQGAPDLERDAFPEWDDLVRASEALGHPLSVLRARVLTRLLDASE